MMNFGKEKIEEYIQWLIDKNNVTFRGYKYACPINEKGIDY